MSGPHPLASLADAARVEGLWHDDTPLPPPSVERPWPVVVLTALGAWLSAAPLCLFFGLLLGDLVLAGAGPYVVAICCLAGAVTVFRARGLPLFVEQLATPALLVGGGLLAFGLFDDAPDPAASAVLVAVALGVAAAVPQAWLRAALGVAAAVLAGFGMNGFRDAAPAGATLFVLFALWGAAMAVQTRLPPAVAAWLESVAAGWLVAVLVGFAVWSGRTYLIGGGIGWPLDTSRPVDAGLRMLSALAAAAAAARLAWAWPRVRRPALALVAVVGVGLAALMAALGGALLAAAVCAVAGRWRLASLAVAVAAWVLGAFYWQLQWALVDKALVLLAGGAVLAAVAWRLAPRRGDRPMPVPTGARWRVPAVLAPVAVALSLVVVNVGIRDKEALIADGRVVLVPLAPVDPRSLAQGDYMQLAFALPPLPDVAPGPAPQVVLRLDPRGVALPLRLEPADAAPGPLSADDVRIGLVEKGGRWVLVTDAWFFAEGQGDRLASAKYGEFRVSPDGRALLVGLRDAGLAPLVP